MPAKDLLRPLRRLISRSLPLPAAALLAALGIGTVRAQDQGLATGPPALDISTAFVQAGWARDANAYVLGATWDWRWTKPTRWGVFTGYWESSIGRWHTKDSVQEPGSSTFVTQIGITPVFRLAPFERHPRWFAEFGIGANVLFPIYQSRRKRFSTTFNFGDHLAIGYRVGRHEIALRWQHFSNAGIRRPNPGEDFVQLRYAWRY